MKKSILCFAVCASATVLGRASAQNFKVTAGDAVEAIIKKNEISLPKNALARLGSIRFIADGEIQSVAFSADGKSLIGHADRKIFVWDSATGTLRRVIPIRRSAGIFALSLGGKQVITWSDEDGVIFLSYETGKQSRSVGLLSDGDGLRFMSISANKKILVYESIFAPITFVDLKTGKKIGSVEITNRKAPENITRVMRLSPGGDILAVCFSEKPGVFLYEVPSGKLAGQLKLGLSQSLDFSPDGRYLAGSSGDGPGHVWDWKKGKPTYKFGGAQRVKFSTDGKSLILWSNSELRTLDLGTGLISKKVKLDPFSFAPEDRTALSPDGKTFVTSFGSRLYRWDLATGKEMDGPQAHRGAVKNIVFAGAKIATTATEDFTVKTWDFRDGKLLGTQTFDFLPTVSPNLKWAAGWIYKDDSAKKLAFWNLRKGKEVRFPIRTDADFRFTPDSHIVFAPQGEEMTFVGLEEPKSTRTLRLEKSEFGYRIFSRDNRWVAGQDSGGKLALWEVATGNRVRTFPGQEGCARYAISPSSRLLAFTNSKKQIQIFETWSDREVMRLPFTFPANTFLDVISFSPNGKILAAGTRFGEVFFWDVFTGKLIGTFHGHIGEISVLKFSRSGSLLASGGRDGTAVIWRVPTILGQKELPQSTVGECWGELANVDAGKAHSAMGRLIRSPEAATAFLEKHFSRVEAVRPEALDSLIAALANSNFAAREAASRKLAELGDRAAKSLRESLAKKNQPPETRKRVAALLERLSAPISSAEMLRSLRAVQVLEKIGPSGQPKLKDIARGIPESNVTQEARASLLRLAKARQH